MRRQERERDVRAWAGSVLVHTTVLAVAWLTAVVEPRALEYQTIQLELVSAPVEDELVVETPQPPPPVEEAAPAAEPEPEPVQPEPEPEAPEPEPVEEEPEPEPPEPEPEKAPEPEPEPRPERRSPESVEAHMEGLRVDFPQYYESILFQMRRCFRWTRGGSWESTVDFVINRDGSVSGRDIEISRSSGNLEFDLRAVEAVECLGTKLDPLPEGLSLERLPVRFRFSPPGSDGDGAPARREPQPDGSLT